MIRRLGLLLSISLVAAAAAAQLHSDGAPRVTVTTLITTPLVIEGLTNDAQDNLYAPGRNAGNRRDNFPSTAGDIGGTGQPRGKIVCIDQRVTIEGMGLPVR